MGITPDKRLREINAGEWEGQLFDDLEVKYKEDYSVWLSDIGS